MGGAWHGLVCTKTSAEHPAISKSITKPRLKPALASLCPNSPSQKLPTHFPSTSGTNTNWPDVRISPRVFSFKGVSDPELSHIAPLVGESPRLLCLRRWQSTCAWGWAVCWRCFDFLDWSTETFRLLFAPGPAACFDASLTQTFSTPPKEQI